MITTKEEVSFGNIERCIKCEGALSYVVVMGSHGRCPLCGYKHPSSCTIIKTREYAVKYVHKVWYFFGIPIWKKVISKEEIRNK